ncbi:SRPBCC family protein [Pseudofulvibacter geojedonensis]|uniref:SRPBCC domain-containing protein n=1 Tax=Pseudofulvibacter geojedonensis TaxID=1123758 RepID=A0ABW3I2X2_9FLAO
MDTINWSSFTKKIHLKKNIQTVYNAWASSEIICTWFLREAVFTDTNGKPRKQNENTEKGDSYSWKWHNWDGEEKGTILEANGKDKLVFSFAGDAQVNIQLTQKEDHTLLELTQSNIPTDDTNKFKLYCGCSNGWTFWIANLKAYLEHGILLHETDLGYLNGQLDCHEYINS